MMPAPDTDDPPASLWAHLDLTLTGIHDQLAAQARRAQDAASSAPIYAPRARSGVVAADGSLLLTLGGPAMGRRWVIRNVSVCDAGAVRTATTGTADIYVGNSVALGPSEWRWPFAALPAAEKFSDDEILVIPHDQLIIHVQGATAGQAILARANVLDYPVTRSTPVVNL